MSRDREPSVLAVAAVFICVVYVVLVLAVVATFGSVVGGAR